MKKYFLILISMFILPNAFSQTQTTWNGKKCAVVLTYDDALNVDLDNAIPVLDSLGLKATFYLIGSSPTVTNRLNEWKAAAAEGHELGNHTLFHPCMGKLPGREFVTADYDLNNYSVKRIDDEITMNNTLLKAIDGKQQRTFAYPCGDTKIGNVDYLNPVKNEFTGARGVSPGLMKINEVDLYNINCYMINGQSAEELIALVKKAMQTNTLLVFLFHGVGGGHALNVSLSAHSKLLHFLKQNEKEIWIAPLTQVAQYIKKQQLTVIKKQ